MSMPAGCVTTADLVAHYAAVRKRLMRSHLRVVPKGIPRACFEPSVSVTISRPAPELAVFNIYSQEFTGNCDEPPVIDMRVPRRITIRDVANAVAEHFDVRVLDMVSQRRTHVIVIPRQIVFYLCRELTTRSLPEIGRRMGDRDHTTVMYGVAKIRRLITDDPEFAAKVEAIRAQFVGWA